MNLMERNLRPVRLCAAPSGAKDADEPAPSGAYEIIRAVIAPCEERTNRAPYGEETRRSTELLYDGARRLAAGMTVTVDAGGPDEQSYRVESVRRYPWLQSAILKAM